MLPERAMTGPRSVVVWWYAYISAPQSLYVPARINDEFHFYMAERNVFETFPSLQVKINPYGIRNESAVAGKA